jgi:hypothetical protein
VKVNYKIKVIGLFLLLVVATFSAGAQETLATDTVIETNAAQDTAVIAAMVAADSAIINQIKMDLKPFSPSSSKAVLYSAIFPGLGQIYNRKYWKLPLVYGAFMGCTYAITWNSKNLEDYSTAYTDIKSDDPKTNNSWVDFIPANGNPDNYVNDVNFHNQLKSGKDMFRRNRDLSIIITVGVYVLCMIDAYVDAELFDFDISPDLSMRVLPEVSEPTKHSSRTYGVNWSIKF